MTEYTKELGQAMFGQPSKQYACPEWVEAYLGYIRSEMDRVMWNIHQKEYISPFGNTGESFKNKVFKVQAYSWDEEKEQKYNFKWKDVEISWYKYCGRGMSINQKLTHTQGEKMLNECLASIRAMDKQQY